MLTALRKRSVQLSVLGLAPLALFLAPGTAQATTCDGGYQFHWHWNSDSLFFDTTMANSTITITRCWDGQGNLTSGTTASITSTDTGWGTINQAKTIDGTFQVTNSAPQQYQGYLPEKLGYGASPPAGEVKVTVSINANGDMSVNTDPPPYIEQGEDPGFLADGDYSSSDYEQLVPPPPGA
ncbi:hypothetical protein ABZT04_16315 [Streptomyces sp. NPDC005492]|uniref:hypothetical protein n=1 Tax=Streptomyces sp. NPDC005492 TaxID=3156883 RepID=UPI0033A32902